MNKLEVTDLSFSYGERQILSHLGFSLRPGEFVSILGPSGCGKSTVLKLLTGVLPHREGSILVDGSPVKGISPHFAYMPQNDLLFPWKTILENVCLYAQVNGNLTNARREALSYFPEFGLSGYEQSYPGELSGGMRQRAAFLRTALCSADILLLDEPFGALDVITRGEMQDWLLNIKAQLNKTVLLVTHDMDEAIYLSDRILVLSQSPAVIEGDFSIPDRNRSRDWIYAQTALRTSIRKKIMGY